jgi:hypothetical protein
MRSTLWNSSGALYYVSKRRERRQQEGSDSIAILARRRINPMIRDPDTLAALLDNVARFVRERLVPNESDVERFYRDVRLFRIYEATSQIQQLVMARNMIREARQ